MERSRWEDVVVTGLSNDSRRVRPGDLFIAQAGDHFDGHDYVSQAVAGGAEAVVSERPLPDCPVPVVVVPDSHRAAAVLADRFYGYPARQLCMIGITGTNGKTTTVRLLESVLREAGLRVGCIGTLGYRWNDEHRPGALTTPHALDFHRLLREMIDDGVSHVIMEVSSHALAQGRVDGCRFRLAVFTNLSRDHLDFHGTMEDYFSAKAELFTRYLVPVQEGVRAVVNLDDPYGRRLSTVLSDGCWCCSLKEERADVRVVRAELDAAGIHARLVTPRGELEIRSTLLGRLNLYNICSAVGAALALDVAPRHVCRGIASVTTVPGRLERVVNDQGFEVLVDYAHTPDAMEKSLECLRELVRGRLWVVFGCGGDRDRGKRPMMGEVAARFGDLIVVTSDNPRTEPPEAIIEDIVPGLAKVGVERINAAAAFNGAAKAYAVQADRRRAIDMALAGARPGDIVYIGGKGHETYQIVGDRVVPFDDREVVRKFLEEASRS